MTIQTVKSQIQASIDVKATLLGKDALIQQVSDWREMHGGSYERVARLSSVAMAVALRMRSIYLQSLRLDFYLIAQACLHLLWELIVRQ